MNATSRCRDQRRAAGRAPALVGCALGALPALTSRAPAQDAGDAARDGERPAHLRVETVPGASIAIDDDIRAPITDAPIAFTPGIHRVRIHRSGYLSRKETIRFEAGETRTLIAPLTPKSRAGAVTRALFVPGWGARYMEKRFWALAFLGAAVASGAGAIAADAEMDDRVATYEEIVARYADTVDPRTAAALGEEMDVAYDEIRNAETLRDGFLIALGGSYALSVAQALFQYPWKGGAGDVGLAPSLELPSPGSARLTLLAFPAR